MTGVKINRRKIPLRGNRLVDWLFKRLLDVYEREISSVKKKRRLTDPDASVKEILRGLLIIDTGEIYLNPAKTVNTKKNPGGITATFIHEDSHKLMPGVYERHMKQLEDILWQELTDAQKRFLKKLLPKHESKKGPTATT